MNNIKWMNLLKEKKEHTGVTYGKVNFYGNGITYYGEDKANKSDNINKIIANNTYFDNLDSRNKENYTGFLDELKNSSDFGDVCEYIEDHKDC